jgi:protein tyrosine phosphatase
MAARSLASVSLKRDALHQRFTSICLPQCTNLTTLSARKRKNAASNRYGNILPFDHNCIKVMAHTAEGARGRYINASLMQVQFCYLW